MSTTEGQRNQGPSAARSVFAHWNATLLGGLVAALYADVIPALLTQWWTDPGYSHGFLIAPLAAYMAWRDRERVLATPASEDLRGILLTLVAVSLYLTGRLAAEFFLTRISLVLLTAGLIWTFWGAGRLRRSAFPLLLFASIIPLPTILYNQLAGPLQLFASRIATDFAQLLGVSVYRDGNIIQLAHTSLGVAEACSGLHSLASLTVTSLLVGHLESFRTRARVGLFFLSIPISIVFNVLRVAATAVLSEYNAELATGFYHSVSGWMIFLGGFGALLATAKLMGKLSRRRMESLA